MNDKVEKIKYVELRMMEFEIGTFNVSFCFSLIESSSEVNIYLNRVELKELRNIIHNALIELNELLDYED